MANNIAGQTITGNSAPSDSPKNKVGRIMFDATAIVPTDFVVIVLGYTPRSIRWENLTDRIRCEWFDGMAADSALNIVAAGTRTLSITSTNGGFTICDPDGTPNVSGRCFKVIQNATLGAVLASKTITWTAAG